MTHFCAILAKEATLPSNHGSTPDTGAEERPAKHLPGTPEKRQSYERQGKMEELPEARRDPGQRRVTGEDTWREGWGIPVRHALGPAALPRCQPALTNMPRAHGTP